MSERAFLRGHNTMSGAIRLSMSATIRLSLLVLTHRCVWGYDCTPLAVYDGKMGRIAEGQDCCNDYYRGCACPEGSCCDYATGKCFPRIADNAAQCADDLYDYQRRYFTMSFHGSCENSCPCLCECDDQAECDECDCPMEDTNPCTAYCFGCSKSPRCLSERGYTS
jgi:hypothetical protein